VVGSAAVSPHPGFSEAQLPPPAAGPVEFTRDIQPILQVACLRCHGPEKPKSGFRLVDRAAAIQGGDKGAAIVVGNSAGSPLIAYVARLAPDLEMPPEGRGEPLTEQQVGLLRAWIDQGLVWEETPPTNGIDVTLAPAVAWTSVSGDAHKFREHYGQPTGAGGGLERFEWFQQPDRDTKFSAAGHFLRDDYRLVLDVDRNDVGFIHSGWEQYRKYYDDTGGYGASAGSPRPQTLGSDLFLDRGKAWVDFGLTLPHWPRLVLGYEYDYRRGQEATTSWGSDGAADARNVAPTSKFLEEGTHVLRFDLDGELHGITVEDRFRGEFYSLSSRYTNTAARGSVSQSVNDQNQYFQGANSFRLEKQFRDWLFGSGGYFYSQLNADDSFADTTINNGTPFLASVPRILLQRESHLLNLTWLIRPIDGLTVPMGIQGQWTRQQTAGSGNLNGIAYLRPPNSNLTLNPVTLASDYEQRTFSETVGLRYGKIPFTSLFADARLQQETVEQSDRDIQPGTSFLDHPSLSRQLTDLRAGFSTSPWQTVSFSAHYRHYEDDSRYQTNQVAQPLGGYPGFLRGLDLVTEEVEAKLVWRPSAWLKTSLSYQWLVTDYHQDAQAAFGPPLGTIYSDAGTLLAAHSGSDVYSLGATLTPLWRLSLSTTLSYQRTRTATASAGFIPTYEGQIYSALVSGNYIFNPRTDLAVSYSLSLADYPQNQANANPESPPPLGIRYQQHALQVVLSRHMSPHFTTRLQYGFYYYGEPSAAGATNYKAQMILASLTYRFR